MAERVVKWEVRGYPTKAFLNGIEVTNESFNFYASRNSAFEEGTKCTLVTNFGDTALMKGMNDGNLDEEVCFYSEFVIFDKNRNVISEPKDVPDNWRE